MSVFGRRRRKEEELEENLDATEQEASAEDTSPGHGPYDSSHAPDDDIMRLDLGGLKIPALPNLKFGMPADENGRLRQEVVISNEDSVLRVAACAAPRNEGIWDEIRDEIAQSVKERGGRFELAEGAYGTELLAYQPDGRNKTTLVRYIGIDGPRWFVRALFHGARAEKNEAESTLDECLQGMIVERGNEAMPLREGLTLQLPDEMMEARKKHVEKQQAQKAKPATAGAGGSRRKPSPKPR